MGATRDSGRGVAGIVAGVVVAALEVGMSQGHAQAPRPASAGPVGVVGDGGEIQAAGATVTITGTASASTRPVRGSKSMPPSAVGPGRRRVGYGGRQRRGRSQGRRRHGRDQWPVRRTRLSCRRRHPLQRFGGPARRGRGSQHRFGPTTEVAGSLSAGAAVSWSPGRSADPSTRGRHGVLQCAPPPRDVAIEGGRITIGPRP